MPFGDTIVALSTPAGEAALALVRLSGPDCERLGRDCFGPKWEPTPRMAQLVKHKSLSGNTLDQCIALYFADDASYTGEPMLELSLHGSPLVVQLVLEDLLARGCRMAEAGEFTKTAFTNGKLDLSQAEAVADLIHARSTRALQVAQRQLAGAIGKQMDAYTQRLLRVQAELEAYIDFPEEDLPEEDQSGPISALQALTGDIKHLIDTQHYTTLLHEGVQTVILGAPNAGKSSLLNWLAGQDRVIVSATPGTTRDVVSERVVVDDYVLQLMDTAGLHTSADELERLGMEKTIQWLDKADFFLVVIDSAAPSPTLPQAVLDKVQAANALVIENKGDLPDSTDKTDFLPDCRHIRLSLKTGKGCEHLKSALTEALSAGHIVPNDDELVVSARHAAALTRAVEALETTLLRLTEGAPPELAASDLRLAVEAFGEVVGKIDNEVMLDQLFASFCIGK
ncbi:tRNA uridine-5-carboxymethylaminomethyl(34) synthesis GTPase MnmE [Ruficoccus sp. ZRK36]|uniref:tRNA uridine-5-carboxymethylaminomethyl(34) synthesis GTPase MnmE n=1 Tax=Ruficoccus sp. ZRK36 TaxID=2866311 RepID=UPI001C73D31C|nr:tRNA uridine-5-carboxymethylaminomethyl(34) synthesis GTPase MnmE [Ruficoccus sp. ZRK36]QYY36607.1 tRNA uridine-5-carboxymethylaminomethyl(34) synthesis GTPase MnmE [Ruficoccus sp. ZRK36]